VKREEKRTEKTDEEERNDKRNRQKERTRKIGEKNLVSRSRSTKLMSPK